MCRGKIESQCTIVTNQLLQRKRFKPYIPEPKISGLCFYNSKEVYISILKSTG